MNIVALVGRMVRDPELRTTPSGHSVASFTVAVERSFSDGEGKREADFVDCVAWRATADFVSKYFTKGKPIMVEGRLQTHTYEAKDGSKHKVTEVVIQRVGFVPQPPRNGSGEGAGGGGGA